jgi:hypothetical protein
LTDLRVEVAAAPWEKLLRACALTLAIAQFAPTFAAIATTVFDLPDAFGFRAMAAALADEMSCAHAVPFLLVVEDLVDAEKVANFMSVVGVFQAQFSEAAAVLGTLTAGQRCRLRQGDPSLGEELSSTQREALRRSAEGITVNGERSTLVSVDGGDTTEETTTPAADAAGRSDTGPATPSPRDTAERRRG